MTRNYGQQGAPQQTLLSVILTPILLLALVVGVLIYNLVGLIGVLSKGGNINYDQTLVNNYLTAAEKAAFEGVSARDNCLSICVFYDENDNSLRYDITGGTNIRSEARNYFSTNGKLGALVQNYLNDEKNKGNFVGALTSSIYGVADEIVKLNLTSSFTYNRVVDPTNRAYPDVTLVELNSQTHETYISVAEAAYIESALVYLEEKTGIVVDLQIDTSVHAFGKNVPAMDVLMVVLLAAIAGLCTFNLVKKIRTFNRIKNDFGDQEQSRIRVNARSPYYDEDDDDDESEENNDYVVVDEDEESEEAEETADTEDATEEPSEDEDEKEETQE